MTAVASEDGRIIPIPLVPVPQIGESLIGFLDRTADLNSFANVRTLLKVAGIEARNAYRVVDNPDGLVEALGLDRHSVDAMCLRAAWAEMPSIRASWAVGWKTVRWRACPICFEQSGIHRREWLLHGYTSCHLHFAPMADLCVGCGEPRAIAKGHFDRCNCGARGFRNHEDVVSFGSQVGSRTMVLAIERNGMWKAARSLIAPFNELNTVDLLKIAIHFGTYILEGRETPSFPAKRRRSWPIGRLLDVAFEALASEREFTRAMSDIKRASGVGAAIRRPRINSVLGRARTFVSQQILSPAVKARFLRELGDIEKRRPNQLTGLSYLSRLLGISDGYMASIRRRLIARALAGDGGLPLQHPERELVSRLISSAERVIRELPVVAEDTRRLGSNTEAGLTPGECVSVRSAVEMVKPFQIAQWRVLIAIALGQLSGRYRVAGKDTFDAIRIERSQLFRWARSSAAMPDLRSWWTR